MIAIGGFSLMVLLIFLFLLQSNKTPNMDDKAINLDLIKNQQSAVTPTPEVAQLQTQDLTVGTGSAVLAGDSITVNYTGYLLDGKKFDSTYDRNQPFDITVGAGQVIQGFDQGVVGMKIGGKRRLIIPSDLAYGAQGQGPIPPNTPLVFDIELLSIKPKETPTPSPSPEVSPTAAPTLTPNP